MMYYRLTKTLNDIGTFIPENSNVYDYIKSDKDYYLSIYKYNENQKKQAEEIVDKEKEDKKTGKVIQFKAPRGVSGINDVQTNVLVFDFDDEHDLNKAKEDTITLVKRLIENHNIDPDHINVSFSGGKGFSVVIKHNQTLDPKTHKDIAQSLAGDLVTWDTKVYNASRIFRIDGTKHNKTGLYKTPIDADELFEDIEYIKNKAKNTTQVKPFPKIKLPKSILQLKPKTVKKEQPLELIKNNKLEIDFSKKPFYLNDAKYVLHSGYIPPGWGNTGMLILCSTYKHFGFDKKDAYYMLKSVNEKRAEIYGVEKRPKYEIWEQVVSFVYSNQWKGGTFDKENELIYEICKEFGITDKSRMESFDSIVSDFFHFADNINDNVIKTGIKSLDESLLITTGMMVGVLGSPSAGKTSLVTSIIEKSAKDGMKPLFHSLDMHKHLMSMRLIQRQSGISAESKLRQSIQGDPTYNPNYSIRNDVEIMQAVEELSEIYRNVEFNFTRGATIESIEEDIKLNKSKHGDKFKLVVVDYLEKVRGPYSDATANSGYVASRLSDLASTYDVAIILLLQPQKSAGDPSEELLSMRKVKGASVIEQDCRVVLTMWRPGFDPRNSDQDKFATVAIVKNNMGSVRTLDYSWNGLKGELNELTKDERRQLEDLRDSIKEEKEAAKSDSWGI